MGVGWPVISIFMTQLQICEDVNPKVRADSQDDGKGHSSQVRILPVQIRYNSQ